MKIDFLGLGGLLLEQVARLTRDEQKAFAEHLGSAVATLVTSSRTSIDDIAVRSIALPFAHDFLAALEAKV